MKKKTIALLLTIMMIMPVTTNAEINNYKNYPDNTYQASVFITDDNNSEDSVDITIPKNELSKVKKYKNKHVGIVVSNSYKMIDEEIWGAPIIMNVNSLKSGESLKVYEFRDSKYYITNKKVGYDEEDNLKVKLPFDSEHSNYFLADTKNQKEIDNMIFNSYRDANNSYVTLNKGKTYDFAPKGDYKSNFKSIKVTSKSKNIKISGTKVKGTGTVTVNVTLKDGGKKSYRVTFAH